MNEKPLLIKPYLNVAAICERHIHETDGALTLFRIVDRFNVVGSTPEMHPTVLQFEVITSFRSGNFRGRIDLSIECIDPSMNALSQMSMPVLFEGDDEHATNTYGKVVIQVKEEGLHWMVVRLGDEEHSRIPFRVGYQPQPTVTTGG